MGNISNSGKDNIYPIAELNLFQVFLRMFQVQLRTTQTCRDVTTGILSTVCVLNYHPWESWTAAVKGKSQEQTRTARGTDAIPRPLVSLHSHLLSLEMGPFQRDLHSCCCSKEYFRESRAQMNPKTAKYAQTKGE